jgi:YD repeat-containing protein
VGDPISITDPQANTTTDTYDAARRLTATTAPNGLLTAYSYDPDGQCFSWLQVRFAAVGNLCPVRRFVFIPASQQKNSH